MLIHCNNIRENWIKNVMYFSEIKEKFKTILPFLVVMIHNQSPLEVLKTIQQSESMTFARDL